MSNPDELMLADLQEQFEKWTADPAFLRLYVQDTNTAHLFAVLHSRLNGLFDFMNVKARTNGHYNADQSRELDGLIHDVRELIDLFGRLGRPLQVSPSYLDAMSRASSFLELSQGSAIPDDYSAMRLEKYRPIFAFADDQIVLPAKREPLALTEMGSGAYANVYAYKDEYYGVRFAIKRARRGLDERDLVRFRREYEIMRSLSFPYVLQVFRYRDERPEYTMEFCDTTLRRFIESKNNQLSFAVRQRIALQFLYGLNYLHGKRILHRDLSPQNILLKTYDSTAVVVKLSDFGLSKHQDSELTRTDSELRGTIVDPTLNSFKEYGVAHEIYAVGVVLWFIFSGRQNLKDVSGVASAVIMGCTTFSHESRYASIREVIRAVEALSTPTAHVAGDAPA